MTTRALLLALLIGITVSSSAVSQEMPSVDWTPGMYWTYQTDVLERFDGTRTEGTLTFLVLAGDGCLTSETWSLAAITRWYDGTEIMIITSHSESLSEYPWRRWPQLVNFIPPKQLPDFLIQFRQIVAAQGLPWGYSYETSMRVETAREDGWSESIALKEIANETVVTSVGSFDNSTAIQYEWASSIEGAEYEGAEGLAWWSPEVGWWIRAEGEERVYGRISRVYDIDLTDWGTLSADEMTGRLADALTSTEAIDPELARGLRIVLDVIGVTTE